MNGFDTIATNISVLHNMTAILGIVAFFLAFAAYLAIVISYREIHPFKVLAVGLSGITLERRMQRFYFLFEGGAILFLTSMVAKYSLHNQILYKVLEIPSMILFIASLIFFIRSQQKHRKIRNTEKNK